MGRPPTVCSDVPSTSRTAIDSATAHDSPPRYSTISNFEASGASTSKQALAEETSAISAAGTSNKPPTDVKRKPPDEKTRRAITIDSSFNEDSYDSEKSYCSSDEEPDELDRRRPREKKDQQPFQNEPKSMNDLRRHPALHSVVPANTVAEHVSGGISSSSRRDSTSSSVGGSCYGRGRTFYFSLLMIHSTFFTLFVIDLLILLYSLIFTISNYLNGPLRYHQLFTRAKPSAQGMEVNELITNVTGMRYDLLLPLFAVQIFWLVSGMTAVIALKLVQPLLQLPYMLISVFLIFASLWVVMRSAVRLIDANSTVFDWILTLAMTLAGTVFAVQFYFLYVKLLYIRALLRKRNAVVSSMTNNISSVEAQLSGTHTGNGGARSSNGTSSASIFAAAIEARIFRRQRRTAGDEPPNQKRQHDKYYSTMTVSTTLDEKFDVKRPPQDADCCSCASCCCNETYSTKSTVIVTDYDEIGCHKY